MSGWVASWLIMFAAGIVGFVIADILYSTSEKWATGPIVFGALSFLVWLAGAIGLVFCLILWAIE